MKTETKQLAKKLWKENSLWELITTFFWFSLAIIPLLREGKFGTVRRGFWARPLPSKRRLSRVLDLSNA